MLNHRYILYARKSSEDKNRQVTSNKDQIKELKILAEKLNLNIVSVIKESQSAKKPGRKGFGQLIEQIQNGEADGVLCWKLDRLARNPIDQGTIAWMLQQNIIKRIQTHSRYYEPKDNVLFMQMEFGMATQYVKDLKVNVKRGTLSKAKRGWNPSPVLPIGYKHNPLYLSNESTTEIVPDDNFKNVNKLWKLFLTGNYSVADIMRKGDMFGITGKSGKPLAKNTYHHLLRKPFYAGYFMWRDENGELIEFKGKHKKMISYDEFLKAQEILGEHHRPTRERNIRYCFPYRGILKCGTCNGYVTAQDIHQVICTRCKYKYSIKTSSKCRKCGLDYTSMKNPSEVKKRYYRCSRKKDKSCEEKSIEEKDIESYVLDFVKSMKIDEDFYLWAIDEIERQELENPRIDILSTLQKRKINLEKRLDGLILMKADGEINAEKYQAHCNEIKNQLMEIDVEINENEKFQKDYKVTALKNLDIARKAYSAFRNASNIEKKSLIREIGYNLILKGKLLSIITPKWISYLKDYYTDFSVKNSRVQPKKSVAVYSDLGACEPLNPILLADQDLG